MPTAGRLTAALALAGVAAVLAYLTAPLFAEGKMPALWWPLCIGVGLCAGWIVVGGRAGRGYVAAIGHGFTGVAAMVFWVLFLSGLEDMISKSLRRNYDGPVEAVIDIFAIMAEMAQDLVSQETIVCLLLGAVFVGLIAEFYARRLP